MHDPLRVCSALDRLVALYAGSHGFDISSPAHFGLQHEVAASHVPILQEMARSLRERLREVEGASVEDNHLSVTIHVRRVRAAPGAQRLARLAWLAAWARR